jgi:hypothetical protein
VGPRPDLIDLQRAGEEVARLRPSGVRAASSTAMVGATLLVQPVGLSTRPRR